MTSLTGIWFQQQFERLNRWLEDLYAKHPYRFNLLCLGLAILVFAAAMLVKLILKAGFSQ